MSRSDNFNAISSIGNGEVDSSILSGSTSFPKQNQDLSRSVVKL